MRTPRRTHALPMLLGLLACVTANAAVFYDDFSAGLGAWQAGAAWTAQSNAAVGPFMSVNTPGDEFAVSTTVTLGSSWLIETEFSFVSLYNDNNWTGTAGIALRNQTSLLLLADVIFSQDAYAHPGMSYLNNQWYSVMDSPVWYPQATSRMKLHLERPPGRDHLRFTVTGTNGFRKDFVSNPIPASILDQVTRVALRGFKSKVNFHDMSVTTPLAPPLNPGPLASGLIAYYPFNGNAYDASGSGHDGIVHSATLTTNRFGHPANAFLFDGINNYISIPQYPDLDLTGQFSLSAWICQTGSKPSGYRIIDKATAGATNGPNFDTYAKTGNGRQLRLQGASLDSQPNVPGATEYSLSEWHHVVATVSGIVGKVYLDGRFDGTGVVGNIPHNSLDIFIGRAHPSGGMGNAEWFRGIIDDVRIYNRALSDSEVNELYSLESHLQFQTGRPHAGSFVSTLTGLTPGQMVIIQSSTNLSNWKPIQTNSASGLTLSVSNVVEPSIPLQVFRAIVE